MATDSEIIPVMSICQSALVEDSEQMALLYANRYGALGDL